MTKETVLNTFKEIISKSGMGEVVSLSENINELADIMIYQEQGTPEYLALNGTPLFPFGEIKNILYQYGEKKCYNYVGSELQFVIELKGDARYILEFGDGICEDMLLNGKWATNDEEIKANLMQYNQKVSEKTNVECLIYSVAGAIETGDDIDDSELRAVQEEVDRYIEENPADKDFLLSYAYSSLQMFVFENKDLFDIKNIIRKLIREKCDDSFIDYIREWSSDPEDFRHNGYYLSLVTTALQLRQEIKEEETVE